MPEPKTSETVSGLDLRAVVRAHEYGLTLRTGAICTCGHIPPRVAGSLRSQQDWHADHLAAALNADVASWLGDIPALVERRTRLLDRYSALSNSRQSLSEMTTALDRNARDIATAALAALAPTDTIADEKGAGR